VRIRYSRPAGKVTPAEARGGGSALRILAMSEASVLASNALRPETISWSTAPSEEISDRASASRPSSCSGAMYCNVPGVLPSDVIGSMVGCSGSTPRSGSGFPMPNSSSLAPPFVRMTLAGFKSR
jgi:hypothetical protein